MLAALAPQLVERLGHGPRILVGPVGEQRVEDVAHRADAPHERWDGGGYPAGLAGEQIPLVGRICAVCDVFDALLSPRPYKEPWPLHEALDELRRERGKHFDPAVVDAFMTLVDDLGPLLFDERRGQETFV